MDGKWNHKIFSVTEQSFPSLAIEIFHFQSENNPVYKAYLKALRIDPAKVQSVIEIPFLPISFFKTKTVISALSGPEIVFESSGTTGLNVSRHPVRDLKLYEESFTKGFEKFYGPVADWCIIGLLPSYLERNGSSLVYMVSKLINESKHAASGFYLNEFDELKKILHALETKRQKTLLIGVTFALLDFADHFSFPLQHTVLMETGGMKGKRKEMIREEVHTRLKQSFQVPAVHSEYGMTELLSQAYSKGDGIFSCPPWMKVLVRDEDDPLTPVVSAGNRSGVLNVIDLANLWSCSFIATDDAGTVFENGSFAVQGRVDSSDIRGCNLLLA